MNGSQISLARANEVQNSVDFMPLIGLVGLWWGLGFGVAEFTALRALQISAAVDNLLVEDEFFPLGALVLLEPVLMLLGFGRYLVESSCLVGCAAVILNLEVSPRRGKRFFLLLRPQNPVRRAAVAGQPD